MKNLKNGEYANTYKQIHSISTRGILKYFALSGLNRFYKLTNQLFQSLSRNRIQFLYIHHIFKDEENPFRKLLHVLMQNHCFITYSEAVERILTGNIDKAYISISFDDGFKNSIAAANIMREFDIKACFFLCGSMIGETDYYKIKEFCHSRLHQLPIDFLSWDEVDRLLREGHEIGSHTMNHPDLAQLPVEQVKSEIVDSFELLTRRISLVKHFSWPLGRFFHFTPYAAKIAFDAGFKSCASAERGCHIAPSEDQKAESLCIRRDMVIAKNPVDHILYFMARNSREASINSNKWPEGYREFIVES
jgi:hypothetical protein